MGFPFNWSHIEYIISSLGIGGYAMLVIVYNLHNLRHNMGCKDILGNWKLGSFDNSHAWKPHKYGLFVSCTKQCCSTYWTLTHFKSSSPSWKVNTETIGLYTCNACPYNSARSVDNAIMQVNMGINHVISQASIWNRRCG